MTCRVYLEIFWTDYYPFVHNHCQEGVNYVRGWPTNCPGIISQSDEELLPLAVCHNLPEQLIEQVI